jgi:hypothetical protein
VRACAVTHALVGLEPRRVEVEAEVNDRGLPTFVNVGSFPPTGWPLFSILVP